MQISPLLFSSRVYFLQKESPFIIPPNAVTDIMKDPFTGDGSQGPSDHL
jgi:hypothetical protein